MIALPVEALESVTLTTALAPVTAGGSGAHVGLAVREPAESWRGVLAFHTTPSGLGGSGNGVAPPVATMSGWDDVSLLAGGPVGPRLGIFAVARGTRSDRQERGASAPLRSSALSLLAQAVYRPNTQDEWRVLGAANGADRPFAGRARLADPTAREEQRAVHVHAAFTRRGAAGPARRAAIAYQEAGETPPDVRRRRRGDRAASRRSRERAVRVAAPRPPLRRERRDRARPVSFRGPERGDARRRPRAVVRGLEHRGTRLPRPDRRDGGRAPRARLGLRILRHREHRARQPLRVLRRRSAGPRAFAAGGGRAAAGVVARGGRDRRGPHRLDDAVAAYRRPLASDRRRRPLCGMGARPSPPSLALPAVGGSRGSAGSRLPVG